MIEQKDITAAIQAARKSAMNDRLALNNKTNWLQADSDAVLLEVAKAYHDAMVTIDDEEMNAADGSTTAPPLRAALDAEFLVVAHLLTNPSALRQRLETAKVITPLASGSPRSSTASLIADLK